MRLYRRTVLRQCSRARCHSAARAAHCQVPRRLAGGTLSTHRYLADSLNEQRSQREPAAAGAALSAPAAANPLDDLRLAVVRALAAAPVILVVDGALGSDAVRLCELVRVRVRDA